MQGSPMVNRLVEITALVLLVAVTIGTTFQVLNYQMLRDISDSLKAEKERPLVVNTPPPVVNVQPPNVTVQQPAPLPAQPSLPAEPKVQPENVKPTSPMPEPVAPPPQPPVAAPLKTESNPSAPVATTPPPEVKPDTPPEPEEWKEYGPAVTAVIQQLFEAKYNDVVLRFTKDLADSLSADALASAMDDVRKSYGDFRKVTGVEVAGRMRGAASLTFRVRVETGQDRKLLFSVSMTPEQKISGLLFKEAE